MEAPWYKSRIKGRHYFCQNESEKIFKMLLHHFAVVSGLSTLLCQAETVAVDGIGLRQFEKHYVAVGGNVTQSVWPPL